MLVSGQGRLDPLADQLGSFHFREWGEIFVLCCELLIGHVLGRSLTHDVVLVVVSHLEHSVFTLGKNEAVGLAIHRLRPQSGSNKEQIFVLELLVEASWEVEQLQLDASVLLWANTFVFLPRAVVVSHWLAILHAVDGVSFPELDLLSFVEMMELPADEGVIVRIALSRDEGASPVCMQAEPGEHSLAERWEVVEPVVWVLEEGDLFVWDAGLPQDLELGARWGFVVRVLLLVFFEFCWRGLVAGCCIVGDLSPESDSGG